MSHASEGVKNGKTISPGFRPLGLLPKRFYGVILTISFPQIIHNVILSLRFYLGRKLRCTRH